MSRFNRTTARPATGTSPIVTATTPGGHTHQGGAGYARDAKSELFLLAVANLVGQDAFYENKTGRDSRFTQLVHTVAVADPAWMARFLPWLRNEANLRTASLVGALEAAHALRAAGYNPTSAPLAPLLTAKASDLNLDEALEKMAGDPAWKHRTMVVPGHVTVTPGGGLPTIRAMGASVLQRPDEPGEALAYWTARYGRALPMPVKRGVGDAALRLYDERATLKYDTDSHGYRFADVLELTHPGDSKAASQGRRRRGDWQSYLFGYLLNRRHGHLTEIPEPLRMLRANAELRGAAAIDPTVLLDSERLRAAGFTWEDALSLAGSKVDKGALWTALIPTMGYMATLRNLRNFDETGVSDQVAATVAAMLADPDRVATSRQLPMRFLSAYRAVGSLRWGQALETALNASVNNIPALPGRTLVLVDRSESMFHRVSADSGLAWADTAALFGAALALRNSDRVDLVQFGTTSEVVRVQRGDSLLRVVNERFRHLGNTYTAAAVQRWYSAHDRVVIVTDEQAHPGITDPGEHLSPQLPLYTWNLAGYRMGHTAGGPNRHTFAGLTDHAFRMIPLLEAGRSQDWPF